jgi:hypothetical protein
MKHKEIPSPAKDMAAYREWRRTLKAPIVGTMIKLDDKLYKVTGVKPNPQMISKAVADHVVELTRCKRNGEPLKEVRYLSVAAVVGAGDIISEPTDKTPQIGLYA